MSRKTGLWLYSRIKLIPPKVQLFKFFPAEGVETNPDGYFEQGCNDNSNIAVLKYHNIIIVMSYLNQHICLKGQIVYILYSSCTLWWLVY